MLKTWSENKKLIILLVLVGIIAFRISSTILNAFFIGEDEAAYIRVARELLGSILNLDFVNIKDVFLNHDHSPLPILMVTPFIYFLGYTEVALRMPNVLLWTLNCIVAALVGWKIGGLRVGFVSGLFLAVSGIFGIEALGLGHSGEVLFVLLLIYVLVSDFRWSLDTPQDKRNYLLGGFYLCVGYLFLTSILPVILTYHLLFAYKMMKADFGSKTFRKYLLYTLPFIVFYLGYQVIFLAIPAYRIYVQGVPLYGQLQQNLGRANTGLNIDSFLVNLRVLNWYVFPFASWLVLAAGIYRQVKKYFEIFLVLLGFGAIWSFYLHGNTGQHFLAYFCWSVPFGIDQIDGFFKQKKVYIQAAAWTVVMAVLFAWTYIGHIKTYSYDAYPRALIAMTWGEQLGWVNNVYRPLHEIASKLSEVLVNKVKYVSLIDGALNQYYYPNRGKYYGGIASMQVRNSAGGQCYLLSEAAMQSGDKIWAVVSYADQNVCPEFVDNVIQYPGSNLKLTILQH